MRKTLVFFAISIVITSCSVIVGLTDSKDGKGVMVYTDVSTDANAYFWEQFHQGYYDSIPSIIHRLNVALADNPYDMVTTAHLGFAHVWALSERQRLDVPRADITEHIYLSRRYFEEAYKMNPHDPRALGFLADMTIAEGTVLDDKRIITDGYFKGMKAIKMWPEFNQFTIGYIFSRLDTTDANFHKAIEWQYQTLDDCACEDVSRDSDYRAVVDQIKNDKDRRVSRACWNTWIAPHNWEGFCLNFGDMLTKKGDTAGAVKMYNLARLSDNFGNWPFRDVLDQRIAMVAQNAISFNQALDEANLKTQPVILFNSRDACMSCHQMGPGDVAIFGDKKTLDASYYFPKKNAF